MRFYLLCLTGFLFAATLLFSQSPIKTEDSQPKFCDSIYIDSVIVLESEQLLTYLSFNFRNEGIVLSAYPILSCTLESNPYYGTNENDLSIISLFDRKGGFSNGRTTFHFQLAKSSPSNTVPIDFVLKGIASLRIMNDQTQIYDTCTYSFNLMPGTMSITSVEAGKHQSPSIVISPNPAVNTITVQYNDILHRDDNIDIINSYGSTAKSITSHGSNTSIDVSDLPTGCYVVRIGEFRTPMVIIR